jgi:hypothetical protein
MLRHSLNTIHAILPFLSREVGWLIDTIGEGLRILLEDETHNQIFVHEAAEVNREVRVWVFYKPLVGLGFIKNAFGDSVVVGVAGEIRRFEMVVVIKFGPCRGCKLSDTLTESWVYVLIGYTAQLPREVFKIGSIGLWANTIIVAFLEGKSADIGIIAIEGSDG